MDTEKEMTDAEYSELDEAFRSITAQFRVLSLSLEKKFSKMWLFFGGGWKKWLCLLNQLVPTGRQRLGYRYHKGVK